MSNATLFLNAELYSYLKNTSLREPSLLKELREETSTINMSQMQIAAEQGQFMSLLIQLMGARKTIEVGVYTGYSSLSVALALPPDGKIIACDVNEEWTNIAKKYWQKAGVSNKIDLRLAPAQDTLHSLIAAGEAGTFDFAFIDADKANYAIYYEQCLQLLRTGGLIAIDNVLWDGAVIDINDTSQSTQAIRAINAKVFKDERVFISMVPIGDGLTLARKL